MSWETLPSEIRDVAEAELSERQLEVLKLQIAGRTVRETALALGIAPSTVTSHRWRVKQKLTPRKEEAA